MQTLLEPETSSRVCITVSNSPNSSRVYIRLCKHRKRFLLLNYKITKIVRALWLADRSVCMRVYKHGCDVKMFCFSHVNHASTNWKKFYWSKLDKFTLFIHFFVGWNLENLYKQAVSALFVYGDIVSEKNPYFEKLFFAKQELITRARPRVQDFATSKNFSFNQSNNKEVCVFFQESYLGLGEFSTVMQTLDFVSGLHNCLEFSQPLSCLYQAMQTRRRFLWLKC